MKHAAHVLAALALLVALSLLSLPPDTHMPSSDAAHSIEIPVSSNGATPTATPECGLAWRVVDSPNPPDSIENQLYAISAVAANDIWAVGYFLVEDSTFPERSLVLHWDGTQWNIASSPYRNYRNGFYSVEALSPNNLWAVGYSISRSGISQGAVEHWAGIEWASYGELSGGRGGFLNDIIAISPDDLWAVGAYASGLMCCNPIIGHWDGNGWTRIQNLNLTRHLLRGVDAVSSNDVWAVGDDISISNNSRAFIMHWDGAQWSIVPNPSLKTRHALTKVDAVAANDVWAVGLSNNGDQDHSLIEHWDGAQWSIVPSPDIGFLSDVSAVSANDVWAVSERNGFLHWDGTRWSAVPGLDLPYSTLNGILALAPNDVWAVGSANSFDQTLIMHYSDPCSTHLIGHVTWQGPPPQPSAGRRLPITLTLKSGTDEMNYPAYNTDEGGYFTVSVGSLPSGTYNWRAKGSKHLANSGAINCGMWVADCQILEVGLVRAGDANNDNQISILDFNILKQTFGKSLGDLGYDERAEFTGDNASGVFDFNLLKNNLNLSGTPPIGPRK